MANKISGYVAGRAKRTMDALTAIEIDQDHDGGTRRIASQARQRIMAATQSGQDARVEVAVTDADEQLAEWRRAGWI